MSASELRTEPPGNSRGVIVYVVNEVYLYIPAEVSAAGFELKIAGSIRITDKVGWICIKEISKFRKIISYNHVPIL